MTGAFSALALAPLLPLPWLLALLLVTALLTGLGLWRRLPGSAPRGAAALVLLAALANPRLTSEQRHGLPDILVVMVDDSPSQSLGDRPRQTEDALAALRQKLERLPNLDLRVLRHDGDSKLFGALRDAMTDIPKRRLAGIVMITDGRVHDVPGETLGAPLHVLLTGSPGERDRRAVIAKVPGFALVGRSAVVTLRIDDPGAQGEAEISLGVDGQPFMAMKAPLNRDFAIDIPIRHAGQTIIELSTPVTAGDLMPANNRTAAAIASLRDRLKVLLISGEPHAGERIWRNLLKSDPAVDLVHFTILRPPEKDDRTPLRELSLITFPVRELFEEKLKDFDLVVFDRYRHRGIMADTYYQSLVEYVRGGGALLSAVGPEFVEPDSIADTQLARILPALPDGSVVQTPFVPQPSALGRRHPVTADLGPSAGWGPWMRQMGVRHLRGISVLDGAQGRPLLVLDQVGEGRVAQVLSDTFWLWARDYKGGGPHDELLRRLAHWLMREPDLEAESLSARIQGGQMRIIRRSLSPTPAEIVVTAPDGSETILQGQDQGNGQWHAALDARQPGLWSIRSGGTLTLAAQGALNDPEMADITATAAILAPIVRAQGGSVRFVSGDGLPSIRVLEGGETTSGRDWIGLMQRNDYTVSGLRQHSLLPAAPISVIAGLLLLLGWRRESR